MDRTFNRTLHQENMEAFRWLLEYVGEQPAIWAAWGTIINKREYLKICLQDMIAIAEEYDAKWIHAGKLLKSGHPHHPLYLPNTTQFNDFDIQNYIKSL